MKKLLGYLVPLTIVGAASYHVGDMFGVLYGGIVLAVGAGGHLLAMRYIDKSSGKLD